MERTIKINNKAFVYIASKHNESYRDAYLFFKALHAYYTHPIILNYKSNYKTLRELTNVSDYILRKRLADGKRFGFCKEEGKHLRFLSNKQDKLQYAGKERGKKVYHEISVDKLENAYWTGLININIRKQDNQIRFKKKQALLKGSAVSVLTKDKWNRPFLQFDIVDEHILSVRQAMRVLGLRSTSKTVKVLNMLQVAGLLELTDNLVKMKHEEVINLSLSQKKQRLRFIQNTPYYVLPRLVKCKKVYREVSTKNCSNSSYLSLYIG